MSQQKISDAVGSSETVNLNGKAYKATPLTTFDIGELEDSARTWIVRIMTRATEGRPATEQAIAIALATELDGVIDKYLNSLIGGMTLISMSLTKTDPSMTPQRVGAGSLSQSDEIAAAKKAVMRISGIPSADERGADTGNTFPAVGTSPPDSSGNRAA